MLEKAKYSFNTTGVAIIPKVLPDSSVEEAKQLIKKQWPNGGQWKFPVLSIRSSFAIWTSLVVVLFSHRRRSLSGV